MGQPDSVKGVPNLAPPEVAEQAVIAEDDLLPAGLQAETRHQDVLDQDIALVEINACPAVVRRRDSSNTRTVACRRGHPRG